MQETKTALNNKNKRKFCSVLYSILLFIFSISVLSLKSFKIIVSHFKHFRSFKFMFGMWILLFICSCLSFFAILQISSSKFVYLGIGKKQSLSLWGTDGKGLSSVLRRILITFLGHESSVASYVRIFTHKAVLKYNMYFCVCWIKYYAKVTCIGYAERKFLQQAYVYSIKLSCECFLSDINHMVLESRPETLSMRSIAQAQFSLGPVFP